MLKLSTQFKELLHTVGLVLLIIGILVGLHYLYNFLAHHYKKSTAITFKNSVNVNSSTDIGSHTITQTLPGSAQLTHIKYVVSLPHGAANPNKSPNAWLTVMDGLNNIVEVVYMDPHFLVEATHTQTNIECTFPNTLLTLTKSPSYHLVFNYINSYTSSTQTAPTTSYSYTLLY